MMKRETRAWLRQVIRDDMDKGAHPAADALATDAEVKRLKKTLRDIIATGQRDGMSRDAAYNMAALARLALEPQKTRRHG